MTIELLCTLGPASMNARVISRLEHLGVSLFRVNLSHTRLEDVERVVRFIQEHSRVPVCLDTEGAQVRTTGLADGTVILRENTLVTVHPVPVPGDERNIGLYPPYILAELRPGDFISIDFNAVLTQVVGGSEKGVTVRVVNGGTVGSNKAVTVYRSLTMPALTDKDRAAIAIGRKLGIRHVALSFANRPGDVDETRALAGEGVFVISKIECRNGLDHLASIAERSDAILIDRGDLSREIPIERIPSAQKYIIRTAKQVGRKVYVATNLLETMVAAPIPTRAEVNDIFNTLDDGADGLVLAAETAIGKYPIDCAAMIRKLVREFESGSLAAPSSEAFSLLAEPHGGSLRVAEATEDERAAARALPVVPVPYAVLQDAEQLALGVFSPLEGFMDRETLKSVLADCRLPGGEVWTMPILMPLPAGIPKPAAGQRLALADPSGTVRALLDVAEVFSFDARDLAARWFGTDSTAHPGAARILAGPDVFVAGKVTLIERLPSAFSAYELTPQQCRFVFMQKGWTRIVGFHGRNVPHRAHEWIHLEALERTHADGLFLSPAIGAAEPGDFQPGVIIEAYKILLALDLYPKGRAVLGAFSSHRRHAGPRETVFDALCRKNMGCSHFIVGHNYARLDEFYGADGNRRLFDSLGDIGIEPVFFDPVGYHEVSGRYLSWRESPDSKILRSTDLRQAIAAGQPVPPWALHPSVLEMLRAEHAAGRGIVRS
ncbi:MAG: sulfate adenylyltransferase [Alphaproteobacteria bacterium]|nr:sulfate adenylyltransferase [Alphaproteobacteria bacterium]MBM3732167.1 sulfate adenylyltransferase [Acidimicrobiia bacterium]MBM3950494.1 sulfate adenylyltransferase [Rhodospirillales bacterium]